MATHAAGNTSVAVTPESLVDAILSTAKMTASAVAIHATMTK